MGVHVDVRRKRALERDPDANLLLWLADDPEKHVHVYVFTPRAREAKMGVFTLHATSKGFVRRMGARVQCELGLSMQHQSVGCVHRRFTLRSVGTMQLFLKS